MPRMITRDAGTASASISLSLNIKEREKAQKDIMGGDTRMSVGKRERAQRAGRRRDEKICRRDGETRRKSGEKTINNRTTEHADAAGGDSDSDEGARRHFGGLDHR